MFKKTAFFKNPSNKNLVVMVLQIHFLILSLILVLCSISFLHRGKSPNFFNIFFTQNVNSSQPLESSVNPRSAKPDFSGKNKPLQE